MYKRQGLREKASRRFFSQAGDENRQSSEALSNKTFFQEYPVSFHGEFLPTARPDMKIDRDVAVHLKEVGKHTVIEFRCV